MADNHYRRQDEEISIGEEKGGRGRGKRSAPYAAKKGKRVLNFFDILVILAIAAAIVMLAMGIGLGDLFGGGDQGVDCKLSYSLTFYNVDGAFVNSVAKGDTLYDADNKTALGVVDSNATSVPYTQTVAVTQVDGEGNKSVTSENREVPGRYNVTVIITVDAVYTEGRGYEVDGHALRLGSTYHIRFPRYVGYGVCTALTQLK